MSKVRFALLGCGRVSQRYLEVFRDEIADVASLVAVSDLDSQKMKVFTDTFGAVAARNMEALVAAKPDVVCVLTQSGYHARHAIELLDRGMNVIVEKPVALTLADADALAQKARETGRMCAVIKQNRFNPAIRFARHLMEDGRFGKLVSANIRLLWCRNQSYYEDGWHGTWAMDGGVLNQQAIHHVDALRWLAGPVEAVCAYGTRRTNKLEAEDTAVAAVRFASGAVGTIEATTAARPEDIEASLTIVGEGGALKINGIALNVIESWKPVKALPGDADAPARNSQQVPTGYGLGHGPYLRSIVEHLHGDGEVAVSVDEATATLELVHALYSSMETEGWVHLKNRPSSTRLGVG